ncbi:LOW QUALITY PROTEIN: uncharacterized protein C3orf36 [Rhinopithecus roxellana]|uniref:LOW QUALITY PROTEIN: uncharacterized protein C3orf36 n=1 Tax=Rhinopithecus roxellana TaxID=61622 RepID=UPI001237968D|nr:LOW QUALITY PROTEIN: uncharacterized protein C3orf36 [Rhinopithecus roxellana]
MPAQGLDIWPQSPPPPTASVSVTQTVWNLRRGSRIQAETTLEGLEAALPQAVSSGLSLVLAPGLVLTCPYAHSGPGGMASEPPPTRLRKAFLAQSTLLESPLEGAPEWAAPHPKEQRSSSSVCSQHTPPLSSIPMAPPPCPPGENHPLCPRSGRSGGHCSIPPSLPSSSTFSLFSSGCWNPSVKGRVRNSQSEGRAGQLISNGFYSGPQEGVEVPAGWARRGGRPLAPWSRIRPPGGAAPLRRGPGKPPAEAPRPARHGTPLRAHSELGGTPTTQLASDSPLPYRGALRPAGLPAPTARTPPPTRATPEPGD